MENYTKRSENILPLNRLLFLIVLFLISCKNKAQIARPIPEKVNIEIPSLPNRYNYDSILQWCSNDYYKKIEDTFVKNNIESVSMILKNYSIKMADYFLKKNY